MVEEDHCVYIKWFKDDFVILSLYLDDILLATNSKEFFKIVKDWLYAIFDMKDISKTTYTLRVKIFRDKRTFSTVIRVLY